MLDGYRYRGRHRRPSTAGHTAARVATAGAVALAPLALAVPAQADDLDAIEQCESGGRNVKNPSSSASGYYQIINGTWAAYGGREFAPTAMQATRAEQETVARRIFAAEGTSPWNASRSCWSGKSGSPALKPQRAAGGAADAPRAEPRKLDVPKPAAKPVERLRVTVPAGARPTEGGTGEYVVKPGDTLWDLALDAGTTWQELYERNRNVVEDPDWIFVGERLQV